MSPDLFGLVLRPGVTLVVDIDVTGFGFRRRGTLLEIPREIFLALDGSRRVRPHWSVW